jgi:flagellar protein FliS
MSAPQRKGTTSLSEPGSRTVASAAGQLSTGQARAHQSNVRKYLETQVKTASKEQLLLMLYDGAIRFAEQAKEKIEEKDYERMHNLLLRAQRIIMELMSTLNKKVGEEIYKSLMGLYGFIQLRLMRANLRRDKKCLEEALQILKHLRETWALAIESDRKQKAHVLSTSSGQGQKGISMTG